MPTLNPQPSKERMKIMAKHSSATGHAETSHVLELSRTNTIMNALKQRAQAVLNDPSLDEQSRATLRYGLETNEPWLAELVCRADAGEGIADKLHCSRILESNESNLTGEQCEIDSTPASREVDSTSASSKLDLAPAANEVGSNKDRIEALAEIICGAGDEAAGALFVLMGMLANSTDPKALANTVKHFAFTRCGELNLFGMVDAQVAILEGELLAQTRPTS
jgi:hypothetical protein